MSIKTNNYVLESSGDIADIMNKLREIDSRFLLIHLLSFIHNTVLVQNLKKNIQREFPTAKLVLLKHPYKLYTTVNVFSLDAHIEDIDISDEVLNVLAQDGNDASKNLDICRKQLVSLYFEDHLTKLPNIYQLRKDLQDHEEAGIINIVIDNFKTINNFYGFMVGDYVIEQIARFLDEKIDKKIYRTSGTEFTVYLDVNLSFYELKSYMTELSELINNMTILYNNNEIIVSATLSSCSDNSHENLFSKASMAMKYALENGYPLWIYEDRMKFEDEYEHNIKLSAIVRESIDANRVVPYFQPIVDNKNGEIVKYESLARLIDSDGNVLAPSLFIPIAKKIKVYNLVTKTIIDKSFKAFEDRDFKFSINLSIDDIMDEDIFDYIIEKLKSSKASKRAVFELLESEAIEDFSKVVKFITEIKRYGASVSIDDFGDGYSNFSYLIKMNVDYLKIDGSLIENIDRDENAHMVVKTIVEFAKQLGLKTIAEYVHSSTVLERVKELDIDYSQGFYIDKPLADLD